VDATPLWVSLVADYFRTTGDRSLVAPLLDNVTAALGWMRECADHGGGFLRYFDESGPGLANQGWKDSEDSVLWRDGSLAQGPIALVEVQAYAYRAALDGAELLNLFGREGAEQWRTWAAALKERVNERFWITDDTGRYPAIALDAHGAAVDSLTSNIGHLLGTGILEFDDVRSVVARLCGPDMFSGFGIRTVSTTTAGYWPYRYHVGTVWSHDTAMAIDGLLKEGFRDEARMIAEGLLDAGTAFDYRLPELFAGFGKDETSVPIPYPASCRPQAWAAASAVVVARALGVEF